MNLQLAVRKGVAMPLTYIMTVYDHSFSETRFIADVLEVSPERTIGVSLRWIKGRYAWKADGLTGFIRHPILIPLSPLFFHTVAVIGR